MKDEEKVRPETNKLKNLKREPKYMGILFYKSRKRNRFKMGSYYSGQISENSKYYLVRYIESAKRAYDGAEIYKVSVIMRDREFVDWFEYLSPVENYLSQEYSK